MSTYFQIVFIVTLMLGFLAGTVIFNLHGKNKDLQREVDYYKRTYLIRRGGGPIELGPTELRSFDGGLRWYAVRDTGEGLIILGLAEEVYPGLLEQLKGFDRLIEHVTKNGPIGSRPISAEDIKVLTEAGFTVKRNE